MKKKCVKQRSRKAINTTHATGHIKVRQDNVNVRTVLGLLISQVRTQLYCLAHASLPEIALVGAGEGEDSCTLLLRLAPAKAKA